MLNIVSREKGEYKLTRKTCLFFTFGNSAHSIYFQTKLPDLS